MLSVTYTHISTDFEVFNKDNCITKNDRFYPRLWSSYSSLSQQLPKYLLVVMADHKGAILLN